MSYRRPRQVLIGGIGGELGWRFTSEKEDGSIVPIGMCNEVGCLHPTANDARICYRNFVIDRYTNFFLKMSDRKPCQVCGKLTDNMIEVDGTPQVRACPDHANIQDADEFIFAGGDELIA